MKRSTALIDKFIRLAGGASVAASGLKGDWVDEMVRDGIICLVPHGNHMSYKALDTQQFLNYISSNYALGDLYRARHRYAAGDIDPYGSEPSAPAVGGIASFQQPRKWGGFLVDVLKPLEISFSNLTISMDPRAGGHMYISDYERFHVPADCLIVGVDGVDCFRNLKQLRKFFDETFGRRGHRIYVSHLYRTDTLLRWLMRQPNQYVHFADISLAAIHVFQSQFFSRLGERATFLVPSDYEERLLAGKRDMYEAQYPSLSEMRVADARLESLVEAIHKYRTCYKQDVYLSSSS